MNKRVSVEHPMAGRSRQAEAAPSVEQNAEKAQNIASEAQDIFSKLDKQNDEIQEEMGDATSIMNLKDFKNLAFLGRSLNRVLIGGFEFEVSTLNAEEQREVLYELMFFENEKRALYTKPMLLTRAIKSINKVPVADAVSAAGFENIKDFVLNLQGVVLDKLYEEYEKSVKESKDIFKDKEEVKDLLKE